MTTYPLRQTLLSAFSGALASDGSEKIEVVKNGVPSVLSLGLSFQVVGGVLDLAGNSVPGLTAVSTLTTADTLGIYQGTSDLKATFAQVAALVRKTPAGSRSAALPAVLTAADHDKNVVLTGTTGSLSVDGTVADGFRCHVVNTASGVATYSGITGLLSTTSLASGAASTVLMAGATVYATASAASAQAATAYSMALSATTGLTGAPVTLTFNPTSGTWPAGTTITPAQSGVAGSFSAASVSPSGGTTSAVTVTFTPSAAGTATFSATNNASLTNPGNATYTATAAAAAYTTSGSPASPVTQGAAITMTFTPTAGGWPAGTVLTPTSSGAAGAFSVPTISPTTGSTAAVSCTFTPSAAGALTLGSTNNASLTNSTGTLSYTVNSVPATAYTMTQSATGGLTGAADTLTFTPTSGSWPAGSTITIAATGATNALANGTGGSLVGSVLTPPAGASTACTVTMTPSAAGTVTIAATNSASMTNPANLTYTATAVATAYTTSLSAASGGTGSPVTVTFTPTAGGWPAAETITPTATSISGTFAPTSITPTAGSTAAVTCTFTPSAAATGTINSTTSPTMTNTSGGQTYTATTPAISYPTLGSSGVSRIAVFDASTGITAANATQGTLITALADQSGNGNNLVGTQGPQIGPLVNGRQGIQFSSNLRSTNKGLVTPAGATWMDALRQGPHTLVLCFKTNATYASDYEFLFNFTPDTTATTSNNSESFQIQAAAAGKFAWTRTVGATQFQITAGGGPSAPVAGSGSNAVSTVYKIVLNWDGIGGGSFMVNGTDLGSLNATNIFPSVAWNVFSIGQCANAYFDEGLVSATFLEMHCITGNLNSTDRAAYNSYLTTKWG